MSRPSKIHPDLLEKARKWQADGYTYRSLVAMTGLSKTQLKYHLEPGKKEARKKIMAKWYAKNRETRLEKMNDYTNEKRWKNERLREKYGLRGKRGSGVIKPIPPAPPEPPKRIPKLILKRK